MFKITFFELLHAAVILTADIACEQSWSERNAADVMIFFFIVCLESLFFIMLAPIQFCRRVFVVITLCHIHLQFPNLLQSEQLTL